MLSMRNISVGKIDAQLDLLEYASIIASEENPK